MDDPPCQVSSPLPPLRAVRRTSGNRRYEPVKHGRNLLRAARQEERQRSTNGLRAFAWPRIRPWGVLCGIVGCVRTNVRHLAASYFLAAVFLRSVGTGRPYNFRRRKVPTRRRGGGLHRNMRAQALAAIIPWGSTIRDQERSANLAEFSQHFIPRRMLARLATPGLGRHCVRGAFVLDEPHWHSPQERQSRVSRGK